jgi:hypothetical protein
VHHKTSVPFCEICEKHSPKFRKELFLLHLYFMNNPDKQNPDNDFCKYVLNKTESQINKHLEEIEMSANAVEILDSKTKEFGIKKSKSQSIEFFFYADSKTKAIKLKKILEEKYTYRVNGIKKSDNKWSIIGYTPIMPTKTSTIQKWAKEMIELAFEYEIEFDGWGMLC